MPATPEERVAYRGLKYRKTVIVLHCVASIARNNGKQAIYNAALHPSFGNREFRRCVKPIAYSTCPNKKTRPLFPAPGANLRFAFLL
jgi:predicted protein tyrosine phosphatase